MDERSWAPSWATADDADRPSPRTPSTKADKLAALHAAVAAAGTRQRTTAVGSAPRVKAVGGVDDDCADDTHHGDAAELSGGPELDQVDADDVRKAFECIGRKLAIADCALGPLREHLRRKGFADSVAEAAIKRAESLGLINEAAYAEAVVRAKVVRGYTSRAVIQRQLQRDGLSEDVIRDSLAELDDQQDRSTALLLAQKRMPALSRLDPSVQRRRLAGMLARRGFSSDIVWSVLTQVVGDHEPDLAGRND